MTYGETVNWLFQQFPAWHLKGTLAYKPGLDNVNALAKSFGNPQSDIRFVHVAGTNGKGSVSNMLASVLMEDGWRTGLFTSPHLFDFRERIRVNGEMVPEQYVIDFCEKIRNHPLEVHPSFFEITWVMALCYFRDSGCEIVVAETGLGGRLDATNIITPVLSVITNIGLDHTAILGDTRTKIAAEKAGIIKPGIPVVIGESDAETEPVFANTAKSLKCRLIIAQRAGRHLPYPEKNMITVKTACGELLSNGTIRNRKSIDSGIARVTQNTGFRGRMQQVGENPTVLLDAAHNPDGIRALIASIDALEFGTLRIVYGTSSDKEFDVIASLFPADARLYITTFHNPRSANQEQLEKAFGENARYFDDPVKALAAARAQAKKNDLILITGSFFLLQEFEQLISRSI